MSRKCQKLRYAPYNEILACLVEVVTLTTPTHLANVANAWFPHRYYMLVPGLEMCAPLHMFTVEE